MADTKISGLSALLTPDNADVFAIVDVSAGATKKITFANLISLLVLGTDSRLTDARTPTAHNLLSASHGDTTAAAAVAGDVIIADGTPKWTRLAKGSDGKVFTMVAGAPAWATPATPTVDVQKVSVDVSAAEMAAINTSPKVLVAASGANTIIHPIAWTLEMNITGAASNAPAWNIAYANAKTNAILATLTLAVNATGHKFIGGSSNNPSNPTFDFSTSDPRNQNLVFRGNADVTGVTGNLRVHLVYTILSTM
jgi:hypothetical protein